MSTPTAASAANAGGGGESKEETTPPIPSTRRSPAPSMTVRARRRREEAVRRLVSDVVCQTGDSSDGRGGISSSSSSNALPAHKSDDEHDWIVARALAGAVEQGLDRDLHNALVQETKDNALRIGQICHDHANVFLASVAQVARLGEPSAALAGGLEESQHALQLHCAGPLQTALAEHEQACRAAATADALGKTLVACQLLATELERARKQAGLGRPRAALQAVEAAKQALTAPIPQKHHYYSNNSNSNNNDDNNNNSASNNNNNNTQIAKFTLEQTPLGKRAWQTLPKMETEVLQAARRAWNRWLVRLKNGDQLKAGTAVLRQAAHHSSVGGGQLGLGGLLPASYLWRAQTAHNLIARVDQKSKVARACRQAYWLDRDAHKEAQRMETVTGRDGSGIIRKLEVVAAACGWYRCWDPAAALLLDPAELGLEEKIPAGAASGSRHGLGGSRHGLGRHSGHGLRHSRHGKQRSLGFRSSKGGGSLSGGGSSLHASFSSSAAAAAHGKWAEWLVPSMLKPNAATRREEEDILLQLPESVHPVRRAELAYRLLGKTDEFIQYYQQNRFGDMSIEDDSRRSCISSLIGDDVSVGSDRQFYAKVLPNVCASIVGFSAVEAALELGTFATDLDEEDVDEGGPDDENPKSNSSSAAKASNTPGGGGGTLMATNFRESSERYERALTGELGELVKSRLRRSQMGEVVRTSILLSNFRSALKMVHPSSGARRQDRELLAQSPDSLLTTVKVAQDEQLRATAAIVRDDRKVPMLVSDSVASVKGGSSGLRNSSTGIPDPEEIGLPFGLNQMKQKPTVDADLDIPDRRASVDEAYNFSESVPTVVRSLHARGIALVIYALCQDELGQVFPEKPGSRAACYVLDALAEFASVSATGMKDSDSVVDEGSVDKAVQVMANITALQNCLPRFLGTMTRGMCHVGLIGADELADTFVYADKVLKQTEKSCDAQVGGTYSLVYEICRNKIDSHINYALDNFNWVSKTARETPNAYCEGLIGYMRNVFSSLGPMDEGSRAGLHFSCCGHVSERLVKLLAGKPGDTATFDDSGLPPIARIDAFGIKNLALDCEELEKFADSTKVDQLRDCFSELRVLTSVMLDKELPTLVLPENAATRRRKYPILSMDKIGNILEKYVGTGLGDKLMGGSRKVDILFIDKKEVQQLVKIVRSQGI